MPHDQAPAPNSFNRLPEPLRRTMDTQRPIPTPWPDLTELAELNFRHKVGIIAQRGSREAKVGRDIAVHAAKAGVPTVLYTGYPPEEAPGWLAVDQTPNPTPADVNNRAKLRINGELPAFVVIERYERISPTPQQPDSEDAVGDPFDHPDYEPESWADQLMWSVREIRIDLPMLLTTVVDHEPELSRRMGKWLHIDHPAMVMTDVCKPTLLVHRTSPQTVETRMEVDPHEYRTGHRSTLQWAPLNLRRS